MKRKNGFLRMVKMMNDDVIIRAYCEECGNAITDEDKAYIDSEGRYFDSIECCFTYHDICEVEF